MSTKAPDDLRAVREVVDTLQPFTRDDRERIIRWAREKLGMSIPAPGATGQSAHPPPITAAQALEAQSATAPTGADIRTFVSQKNPGSDTHFAATVAYYYQFMAPELARRNAISKDDLVDACRKVDRKRPAKPAQVLVNAYHDGILDRAEKGQYRLNSVGENLVAMVLPGAPEGKRGQPSKKKGVGRLRRVSAKRPRRRRQT